MKNKEWYGNNINTYGGTMSGKYPSVENGKETKEHCAWIKMLERCNLESVKTKHPTYYDAHCCNEWLEFDNFYEWIINQDNYDIWKQTYHNFNLDKDIIQKGNKYYSPKYCELVPDNVNKLFTKRDKCRGDTPIGVTRHIIRGKTKNTIRYYAQCTNNFDPGSRVKYLGSYYTAEEAFYVYKQYKEELIKRIAEYEYNRGTITKRCYQAMLNYQVEIID